MKAYLEQTELKQLEEEATCLRDRLLIRLLAMLGCRISEALALKVEDIDTVQGTVTIEHLKSRLKLSCPQCRARLGRSHAFCPGCGARVEITLTQQLEHRRMRTLPIDDDSLGMLKDYICRGGPVFQKGTHHQVDHLRVDQGAIGGDADHGVGPVGARRFGVALEHVLCTSTEAGHLHPLALTYGRLIVRP